ncbi:hypothetical protein B0H17DRAFT_1215043 [Mycena rosella]|uniref:SRPBCC family protein n=1 Tax=Mycena rosella TaxID=1033263 RepID=A0AAD7CLL5_MYCRO|nr:hypothetical protein B0H17DRAFT_1215043 [Mycena rosella]
MPPAPIPIPQASEWGTYMSTVVVIHAPRQQVNPFIRAGMPLNAAKAPLPRAGHFLVLHVQIPPTMHGGKARALTEHVKRVEPLRVLAWGANAPRWLLGAQHWNVLSDVEGGTRFEIVKVYGGLGARLMPVAMMAGVAEGIEAMAEEIKARSERVR